MSGHTPGPWHYGDEDEGLDGISYVDVHVGQYGHFSYRNIARIEADMGGNLDAGTRANAHLASAAPQLLEALELLHAELFGPAPDKPRHVIDEMSRAAIAKAKGQGA